MVRGGDFIFDDMFGYCKVEPSNPSAWELLYRSKGINDALESHSAG